MNTVIFEGWEVGMRKISFSMLLTDNSHLGLKEARSIKDKILANEVVELELETEEIANFIVEESRKLGVKCRLKE